MPKQRCLDCGKICYGWGSGPCPYCQSFNLEHLAGVGGQTPPVHPSEQPEEKESQTSELWAESATGQAQDREMNG